jgi:tetratricopeptide (TPR) repeat protein
LRRRWPPGHAARPALGLALLLLAACSSAEARLEAAGALRHRGDAKGALTAYQGLLASLGDGPLAPRSASVRERALRAAGDLAYLELGDYAGAIAYYRRIISLHPGSPEALEARAVIGDIFRDRFQDRLAAIAQYADVAASDAPQAPRFQLEVARQYLELGNTQQARLEARALRERWPTSLEADQAQLLTGQAWSLDKRTEEALGAFQALLERRPAPELSARALEGQALLYAQNGQFDRALELYALALPIHPNPEAIRTNIEAVRRRRTAARTARPGDRNEAFDYGRPRLIPREGASRQAAPRATLPRDPVARSAVPAAAPARPPAEPARPAASAPPPREPGPAAIAPAAVPAELPPPAAPEPASLEPSPPEATPPATGPGAPSPRETAP